MNLKKTLFILSCIIFNYVLIIKSNNIINRSRIVQLGSIEKFNDIIKFLTPYKINQYTKKRIGRLNDGGYVVPTELISIIERNYTYGVSDDISFEQDLVNFNQNIISRAYDHTVNYPNQISKNLFFKKEGIAHIKSGPFNTYENHLIENKDLDKKVLLKLDIEGAEWGVLDQIKPNLFKNIPVLILEIHWLDQVKNIDLYHRVLRKIFNYFTPFHIHGNNCSHLISVNNKIIPNVIEITYINNSYIKNKEKITSNELDNKDTINCPDNIGFNLDYWKSKLIKLK